MEWRSAGTGAGEIISVDILCIYSSKNCLRKVNESFLVDNVIMYLE